MCFRIPQRPLCRLSQWYRQNSIFCGGCSSWVHRKCRGIPSRIEPDLNFRCERCTGEVREIDGRPNTEVTVGSEKLEVVPTSLRSRPFSALAHFPSPPEEEFTIRTSEASCSMQAQLEPQPYLTCIACNTMAKQRSAGCMVLTLRTEPACEGMHLYDLAKVLRTRRIRWGGRVERHEGWVIKVQ